MQSDVKFDGGSAEQGSMWKIRDGEMERQRDDGMEREWGGKRKRQVARERERERDRERDRERGKANGVRHDLCFLVPCKTRACCFRVGLVKGTYPLAGRGAQK